MNRFERELLRYSGQEGLCRQGILETYQLLPRTSFNPATVQGLMCRRQLSVGWDGILCDCDFNPASGLPLNHEASDHISFFPLMSCGTEGL